MRVSSMTIVSMFAGAAVLLAPFIAIKCRVHGSIVPLNLFRLDQRCSSDRAHDTDRPVA